MFPRQCDFGNDVAAPSLLVYSVAIAITLTREVEEMMAEDAQALGYESPTAYVIEHLTALHESEVYLRENREEISAMIDEGWEEAERGELLTPEEAKQTMNEWKRDWVAKRSAA